MQKSFRLSGLCCANCGDKIERAIKALPGVNSATVNFMTTKLTIDALDQHIDSITDRLPDIVHKYEPDVVLKKA
jgi:copper chaperone CopZ